MPARKRLSFLTEDRLNQGYVIILPGIEGYSYFNRSIARGLVAGGIPYAIEIYDWTLGPLAFFYNLRGGKLHRQQIEAISRKIMNYQSAHPGNPVYLVGHSGGGAMALMTLASLPEEVHVSGAVVIGAAVSPGYDVCPALKHTTEGIWNISSWGDLIFLGAGTLVFGTIDGHHALCAGLGGFRRSVHRNVEQRELPPLREIPYRIEFCRLRNLGGHFGATSPRFVGKEIASWLLPKAAMKDQR